MLHTIKPPNRPWQTHNSVFFFKFPHGARVTSIPRQISTSLATLFRRSHKFVASRHKSAHTLCCKQVFCRNLAIFPFFKMGICNRIFPLQKTSSPFADFSPQKNDWLTHGSCRHRECMGPSSCDMLTPVKLIDWRLLDD